MRTDERWEPDPDGDPSWESDRIDGAWGRTANPNSVDGELQNLAAFGNGLVRLTGPKRTAARIVVLLLLLSIAATIVFGVVGIVSMW